MAEQTTGTRTPREPLGIVSFDWTETMANRPQDQIRIATGGELISAPSDSYSQGRVATLVLKDADGTEFELVKGDMSCIWGAHQPRGNSQKAFQAIKQLCAKGETVELTLVEVRAGKGRSKVATNVVKF